MKAFVLASILLAATVLMVLAPDFVRADDARDPNLATLLVKVPPEKVGEIAALARALGGQAYDVETLERIAVPGESREADSPALQVGDVTSLVAAVISSVAEMPRDDVPFLLDRLSVNGRNLQVRVVGTTPESVDRFRASLLSAVPPSGWVVSRVEAGAVQRMKDGRVRTELRLVLAPPAALSGDSLQLDDRTSPSISTAVVQAAAARTGLQMIYASALQAERVEGAGVVVYKRDITFDTCDIDQLRACIEELAADDNLIVSDVRLGAADLKQQVAGKPLQLKRPVISLTTTRRIK